MSSRAAGSCMQGSSWSSLRWLSRLPRPPPPPAPGHNRRACKPGDYQPLMRMDLAAGRAAVDILGHRQWHCVQRVYFLHRHGRQPLHGAIAHHPLPHLVPGPLFCRRACRCFNPVRWIYMSICVTGRCLLQALLLVIAAGFWCLLPPSLHSSIGSAHDRCHAELTKLVHAYAVSPEMTSGHTEGRSSAYPRSTSSAS